MNRIDGPHPLEDVGQERLDEFQLVRVFHIFVVARRIVRLVPDVPAEDARIVTEQSHDAGDIALQDAGVRRILQPVRPRTLHPAGVVHPLIGAR